MRSALHRLPKDKRGFPIPWFVTEKKENGDPDFVKITPMRVFTALISDRCWICGGYFGRSRKTFVCGPMSLASRHCSEPPMHLDCARFAVKTCPFMVHPNYNRQWTEESKKMPGLAVDRNPKVTVLITVHSFRRIREGSGFLFSLPTHARLEAWREGRAATREEYLESLEEGRKIIQEHPEVPPDQQPGYEKIFNDARELHFENMVRA